MSNWCASHLGGPNRDGVNASNFVAITPSFTFINGLSGGCFKQSSQQWYFLLVEVKNGFHWIDLHCLGCRSEI